MHSHGEVVSTTIGFLTENSTSLNFTKFPTFSESFGGQIATQGNSNFTITDVHYISIDTENSLLFWCDKASRKVKFTRYGSDYEAYGVTDRFGILYTGPIIEDSILGNILFIPVGIALDDGSGLPRWGNYIDCFGNGVCPGIAGNFICNCNNGFSGDCQTRACPVGRAWFHEPYTSGSAHDVYTECSNAGICDRLRGTCVCRDGFEGTACQRLSCFKNSITGEICSNRGICRTMREMASFHLDDYLSSDPVVYGSLPNDPGTWDADSIMGCVADTYGYLDEGQVHIISPVVDSAALDEFQCAKGYNLKLTGNVNITLLRETQMLSCTARSGYFQLEFRGVFSQNISFDATIKDFHTMVQNVPSIGAVELSLSSGVNTTDPICFNDVNRYVQITFVSVLGKIPLIIPHAYKFGRRDAISVERVVEGKTDGLLECSGHGDCLTGSGACYCWNNYAPSNGISEFGYSNDCGYHRNY